MMSSRNKKPKFKPNDYIRDKYNGIIAKVTRYETDTTGHVIGYIADELVGIPGIHGYGREFTDDRYQKVDKLTVLIATGKSQ